MLNQVALSRLLLSLCLMLGAATLQAAPRQLDLVLAVEPPPAFNDALHALVLRQLQERIDPEWRVAVLTTGKPVQELRALLPASALSLDRLFEERPASTPINPAMLLERALYTLEQADSVESAIIILITAGELDATDAVGQQQREWLLGALLDRAKRRGVVIHSLILGDKEDISWIQPLSHSTNGSYFRITEVGDIASQLALLDEALAQRTVEFKVEELVNWLAVVAIVLLFAVVVLLLWRERRLVRYLNSQLEEQSARSAEDYFPEAFLLDLHHVCDKANLSIGGHYTLITRLDSIPDSNIATITVPFPSVGRRHALIEYRGNEFWLIDQNSVNGSFINGVQVFDPVRLTPGDRVRFHNYEFEFARTDFHLGQESSSEE